MRSVSFSSKYMLAVAIATVVIVVFLAIVLWILCRKYKLTDLFKRNKPIKVHMFNSSIECRRNAVIEETFQNRETTVTLEVPVTTDYPVKTADVDVVNEDPSPPIHKKYLSKSLLDLRSAHLVQDTINEEDEEDTSESSSEKPEESEQKDSMHPDNAKYTRNPKTGHFSTVQYKARHQHQSITRFKFNKGDFDEDTLQKEKNSLKFSSLFDLHRLHSYGESHIPRATSIERIPIDNARKFRDCQLTEISPGCYSIPIQYTKKKENEFLKASCEIHYDTSRYLSDM